MKSNYEERKANRLEKFTELADKNEQKSNSSYSRAKELGDCIPMGQPILVGHHSERGHRAHIKKIDNSMRASIEHQNRAEYYRGRAESLKKSTAISSDDPNSIEKLRAKLERLEHDQELYKDLNKIIKSKKSSDIEKVEMMKDFGVAEATAIKLLSPDFAGRIGIPSYTLTNNGAVIRNTRERIEAIEKNAKIEDSEEVINSVILRVNQTDNRVQLKFPGIPNKAMRETLKRSGFHWAQSLGVWQRMINSWAIHQAREILNNNSY